MAFTPPDIIILLILAFFTFGGFKNGFIKEAARIIGMVGGFASAYKFHDELMPHLELYFSNPNVLTVVSYLVVFSGTLVIINAIAMALQKLFEFILLGWLNRLLGTLLGLIKGILVVSLIIFVLEIAPTEIRQKLENDSEMYKICNVVKSYIIKRTMLNDKVDAIQEDLYETIQEPNIQKLLEQE